MSDDDPDMDTLEASYHALVRLGQSIGCDHASGVDGVMHTERCIADVLANPDRQFSCDLWGWPSFGLGKLQLRFDGGTTYTIWLLFLTRKLSFGIHIGGKSKHA